MLSHHPHSDSSWQVTGTCQLAQRSYWDSVSNVCDCPPSVPVLLPFNLPFCLLSWSNYSSCSIHTLTYLCLKEQFLGTTGICFLSKSEMRRLCQICPKGKTGTLKTPKLTHRIFFVSSAHTSRNPACGLWASLAGTISWQTAVTVHRFWMSCCSSQFSPFL